MPSSITIRNARLHNLKGVSLRLPIGQWIVFTGLSGSGKSTLGFDILDRAGRQRFYHAAGRAGLHPADVTRLLALLHRLVEAGHSLIVVEHNLDLIQAADWVIDLGPEGGAAGGQLIAEGPPEQIAQTPGSYTGACLRGRLW